ncbi:hypothetical protein [Halomarina rubra]|uniref:Uncharacterized protein n=1 Tax=Halomarina rubra TaxID=2071873 RepID=A0ABD6AST1_9EURY|nr:hypothetical protein [Halomarina rubra]
MSKVSIGLRGWRFDEQEILGEDGTLKPLAQIPPEPRERIARLATLVDQPCDVCWLIHGEEEKRRCKQAKVVYGEPLGEVLLCDDHEREFLYWFREVGGADLAGDRLMQNAFHQWFVAEGEVPDDYGGMEHVDTDPDELVQPEPNPQLDDLETELAEMSEEERDALGIDFSDLDL